MSSNTLDSYPHYATQSTLLTVLSLIDSHRKTKTLPTSILFWMMEGTLSLPGSILRRSHSQSARLLTAVSNVRLEPKREPEDSTPNLPGQLHGESDYSMSVLTRVIQLWTAKHAHGHRQRLRGCRRAYQVTTSWRYSPRIPRHITCRATTCLKSKHDSSSRRQSRRPLSGTLIRLRLGTTHIEGTPL